jgi:hypothetical protein
LARQIQFTEGRVEILFGLLVLSASEDLDHGEWKGVDQHCFKDISRYSAPRKASTRILELSLPRNT